jgi:leucine-zipper of insertion element IS481
VAHANARLTPAGRLLLGQRIAAGRPVAHIAAEMGISRACADRWWGRYRQAGPAGLIDRPSRAPDGGRARCSGDNCQSSLPHGPAGSRQVRVG